MFSPFAIVLIPIGYLFFWPVISAWLEDSSPLLNGLTAVAASMGAMGLMLMWLGLLPAPLLVLPTVLVIMLLGLGAGYLINPVWFSPQAWWVYWRGFWQQHANLSFKSILAWAVFGILSVILIHAVYYPFLGDDVLARYGLHAQQIYRAGYIPESVSGYPPLAALTFVWTWLVAGNQNEQLAKLFAVVMTTSTLGATYLLGRMWLNKTAGWIAVVLVALVPSYVLNSTIAYVDIPTVFPVLLSIIFIWRWWQSQHLQDVIVAGTLIGTALLIKQSALTFAASMLGVILLYLVAKRGHNAKQALLALLIVIVLPTLIAGPWYLRNYLLGQTVLPVAGEYHLLNSSSSLRRVLVPYALREEFGVVISEVLTVGFVVGVLLAGYELVQVVRGKIADMPVHLVFAGFVLPYWLAWWLYFSFDPRFILLILPFFGLWCAFIIMRLSKRFTMQVPQIVWRTVLLAVLALLAYQAVESRLGGVYHTLTDPFASNVARLQRAKSRFYGVIDYVRQNIDPEENRIMLMDGRMAYFLPEYDVVVSYPLDLRQLDDFDYLVHSSGFKPIYESELGYATSEFYLRVWSTRYFDPVFDSDGVHVMGIKFDSLEDRIRIAEEFGEDIPER